MPTESVAGGVGGTEPGETGGSDDAIANEKRRSEGTNRTKVRLITCVWDSQRVSTPVPGGTGGLAPDSVRGDVRSTGLEGPELNQCGLVPAMTK